MPVPDPQDDLAVYALKVAGRDRSWMTEGLCRTTKNVPAEFYTVSEKATVPIVEADGATLTVIHISGNDAQRLAADQCMECSVQWECARWAIEVEEEAGVWAMKTRLLRWLQGRPDATAIIDTARVHHQPVQVAVQIRLSETMQVARRRTKE